MVSGSTPVPGSEIDAQLQRALDYGANASHLDQKWKAYQSTLAQYVRELRSGNYPTQDEGRLLASTCEQVGVRAAIQG